MQHRFVAKLKGSAALRYALAIASVAVAAFLQVSPFGPLLHATELFLACVLAAAWFGGVGPGCVAALLATIALPRLAPVGYPLIANFFDLPHFLAFGMTGAAVGWSTTSNWRAEAALHRSEKALCEARNELDRKVAERTAALRSSEERYALATAASEEGFWDWFLATGDVYISPRLLEMFGFAPDTVFASLDDFLARLPVHPEYRLEWDEAVAAHFDGGTARFDKELRILGTDETRWLHVTGVSTRNGAGKVVRWTGATRDVTTRKRTEEALRLSEERFALALLGAEDGIWDRNMVTGMAYASPRAQEITLGRPSDGVDLRPESEWNQWYILHPDDVPRREAAARDHMEGRTPRYDGEWRVRHPDGSYHWVRSRGICTRDASGRAIRLAGSITDIDARKRTEEALRISEERYALAMEAAQDGHWDWNVGAGEYYTSPRDLQLYGLPAGSTFASQAEFLARLPLVPEDRDVWMRAVADLFASTQSRLSRDIRANVHGETRWIQLSGVCLRDASGRPARWLGTSRDVTDRKRAEEALRISEERFALAVAGAKDGIWDLDLTSGMLYLSPRVQEISMGRLSEGVDVRHECEWRQWLRVHPDDTARREASIRDHLRGLTPRWEGEWRMRHPDGIYHWVHARGICTRDASGRAVRFAGSVADIDARKRIEEELRSRQEMLELAQKAAHAVAFDWQLDARAGECGRLSPELEAVFGLSPSSYDGNFKSWMDLVHPEDWPAVRDELRRANETGNVATEYRVVQPGGAVRWLQAKGKMLFDVGGKPVRMIGFMLDVTDRHEAEDELRRLEKQLRQAQRLEAVGTLAGGIAHDFNNILGVILGYGEMALLDAPKRGHLRQDLNSIIVAGERGRALVERILAFSRSGVAERVAVHVEKVVRESMDLLTANLPAGIAVETELLAGWAAMQGDPTQVHQVVMNLVTNGVQAMAPGGLLRVSLDVVCLDLPRCATTGTVAAGDYIQLKVADSGSGIPAAILDRIFDPFFTTKEVGVGTGLGLSLVHGIVTEVGGAIDVETAPDTGSVFTVYLPRTGDAAESKEEEQLALPRGSGQRVLVVDDEEPLVRLATQTLKMLGYAPAGFTSSTAALEAFRANPKTFDAVLTDERMPGMSGSTLIREMRGIRRKIPMLLVSGYVGGTVADNAFDAGADEVLKKPLSARDLADSLARALKQ